MMKRIRIDHPIETLETRVHLSATHHHAPKIPHGPAQRVAIKAMKKIIAQPSAIRAAESDASATPAVTPSPGPPTYTPQQMQHLYGIDAVQFNGLVGDGAGQTIAIIDPYAQPHLLPTSDPNYATAGSDLYMFDQQFGLPDPPSFKVIDENGGNNLPAASTSTNGWADETSLDVQWAHAIAPKANLILVECDSANLYDLIRMGTVAAVNAAATVISMSFTAPESSYDNYLQTTGITYVAATGDGGASTTGYPSTSAYTVGVGGTTVTSSGSGATYVSETTWNNQYGATGGAFTTIWNQPDYQQNYPSTLLHSSTKRGAPDVAFDGDPGSGAWVLDTANGGNWYKYGGTSLSAPCWAGLFAIANQGRASIGLSTLSGRTQTLPRLYQLPSTDFHDITTGNNNGSSAGIGYDLTTGLGTPVATSLLPDLAGGATVNGRAFQDNNADGIFNSNDTPYANTQVYLDLNNLGTKNSTDPVTTTDANGLFTFSDVIGGVGTVRFTTAPSGMAQVGGSAFTTSFGSTINVALAYFPTVFTDAGNNDTYTLRLNPALPSQTQILINNTLSYFAPTSMLSALTFNFTGNNDTLVIDNSAGSVVSGIAVTCNAGSTANNNTLNLIASSGNDTITFNSSNIVYNTATLSFSNVANFAVDPRAGIDSLTINSGTVKFPTQTPGAGFLIRKFSALAVGNSAHLIVPDAPSHSDRALLIASGLFIAQSAQLDLNGNDMIIHSSAQSPAALIASGFANAAWTGNGIISTTAKNDSHHLTTLGVLPNTFDNVHPIFSTFDGQPLAFSDTLIKYTYFGDADLTGELDGTDYNQIDFATAAAGSTGWVNGDFNYDGKIDGSDYTLLDNAFNQQTGL